MVINFPVRVRVEITAEEQARIESQQPEPRVRIPVRPFPRSARLARKQRIRAVVLELFARGDLLVGEDGQIRSKGGQDVLVAAVDEICEAV